RDLLQGIVGVVGGELARRRVVAERVVRVGHGKAAGAVEPGADREGVDPGGLSLAAADGVVAGAAVNEIVAQAAVYDVVATQGRHQQMRGRVEPAGDVGPGAGERSRHGKVNLS